MKRLAGGLIAVVIAAGCGSSGGGGGTNASPTTAKKAGPDPEDQANAFFAAGMKAAVSPAAKSAAKSVESTTKTTCKFDFEVNHNYRDEDEYNIDDQTDEPDTTDADAAPKNDATLAALHLQTESGGILMGTAVVRVNNPKLDAETALNVCKLLDPILFPKAKKLEIEVGTKLGTSLAKAFEPGGCKNV